MNKGMISRGLLYTQNMINLSAQNTTMTLPSLSSLRQSKLLETRRQELHVCQIKQQISTLDLVQTLLSVVGDYCDMTAVGNLENSIMSLCRLSQMQLVETGTEEYKQLQKE